MDSASEDVQVIRATSEPRDDVVISGEMEELVLAAEKEKHLVVMLFAETMVLLR